MFRFEKIEVLHWDYWRRFSIPLESAIVTVVGPNGSGKTTLLDAFRTLLAIECASGRDYKRYVRRSEQPYSWLRAVVQNPRRASGQQAFFPIKDPLVTLLCRIRKKGGDWERQYGIAAGDVTIEQAEASPDVRWVGLRQYESDLEHAGLTRAIRRVLALEQGDTDKLCEYSPRQLLALVFNVFGDQEVLDNYAKAQADQDLAQKELEETEARRAELGLHLQEAEAKVNSFLHWMRLTQEAEGIQAEWLPRIRIADTYAAIKGTRAHLAALRQEHAVELRELSACEQRARALEAELQFSEHDSEQLEDQLSAASEQLQKANRALAGTEALLAERKRLEERAAQQTQGFDAAALSQEQEALREELSRLKTERAELRSALPELESRIGALESGRAPTPADVIRFRQALDGAGILHRTLGEIVSVTDEDWQGALEAILKPYRHVILLERSSDAAAAWALGEQHRYRHFVVPDRVTPPAAKRGTLAECLRFSAPVPAWLFQQLNDIQRVADAREGANLSRNQAWITPAGFHGERRGARDIGVSDFHFGARALEQARQELQRRREQLESFAEREQVLAQRLSSIQALLSGSRAAQDLADRTAEFAAAEARLDEQREIVGEIQERYNALRQREKEFADRIADQRAAVRDNANRLKALQAQLPQVTGQLREARVEQGRRIRTLRQDWRGRPQWRSAAARSEAKERFNSISEAERALDRLHRELSESTFERDAQVVAIRDKLRNDHNQLERAIQDRGVHLDRARRLTDDARSAYINKLRATIRRYAQNVTQLGAVAGIDVQVQHPEIRNDDLALAQAGLEVQFNFDQKGLIGLNDGEASGGQQVMKSMILLVGLMMDDANAGGFVFIDEPFAHLDIFNIDKVGAFLASTRAQYILTAPVSHNVNVFKPSGLTLVTQKRKPGERWAPPVGLLTRQASPGA